MKPKPKAKAVVKPVKAWANVSLAGKMSPFTDYHSRTHPHCVMLVPLSTWRKLTRKKR